MARKKTDRSESWEGVKKPLEVSRANYRCPECNFQSEYKIAVLSHYKHNHHTIVRGDVAEDLTEKKYSKKIKAACCSKQEFKLLLTNNPEHQRAKKLGYTSYCINCEELK